MTRARRTAAPHRVAERPARRQLVAGLLVWGLSAAALTGCAVPDRTPAPASFAVVAAYADAGFDSGLPSLIAAAKARAINEVSPVMYRLRADAGVDRIDPAEDLVAEAHGRGARVVATTRNLVGETWDGTLVHTVISNPRLRGRHVTALADQVKADEVDGIDLDYENLLSGDRTAMTAFVTELASALHGSGKVLTIAVPAMTAASVRDDPALAAFDITALGKAVDEIRVMAYDHAWAGSPAGAVAPLPWVREVVDYVTGQVPREKLVLGLAAYGYDWSDGRGEALTTDELRGRVGQTRATVTRDGPTASPWFRYTKDGREHTVWYEDAASAQDKIRVAAQARLAGVFVWRLGGEDRALWPMLTAPAH